MSKILSGICVFFMVVFMASNAFAVTYTTYDNDISGFNSAISGFDSTILDFEELSNFEFLTNQYQELGVTFSAAPAGGNWSGVDDEFLTVREGAGSLSGSNPIDTRAVGVPFSNDRQSEMTAEFSSPMQFLGAYFIDNGLPLDVTIYTPEQSFTISIAGEEGDSAKWWGVVVDDAVITKAVFTTTSTGDFFAFDNFTFGEPVPEPSTLLLLGLGLIGLAGVRRRFKK